MIEPARTEDARATLVAYLASKVGVTPFDLVGHMPFEVVSVTRVGRPMGAIMYLNYRGTSIEMIGAGEPGWLTRGSLRAMFGYPFLQLKCWTVIVNVKRSNVKSRKLVQKLGFVELGVIESGPSKSDDVILYKMTRDRCIWLGGMENEHPAFKDGIAGHG